MKKIFKGLGKGLSLGLFILFSLALVVGVGAVSASAAMPTNTSIIINGGAATTASTSATLTLTATGATLMEISNDPTFSAAVWEPFMVTKSWMLSAGDGLKTVYAMFRDSSSDSSDMSSHTSAVVSDTITLSGSGTVATVTIAGCGNSNVGFSTLTGQSCATNTVVGTASVPGCGNSNVGFSPLTGASCATNPVTTPMMIPGCGNSTAGFSRTTGQSCANNLVNPGEDTNVSGNTNVAEDTFDFGNDTLMDGSSGPAVMDLQKFLNKFENENLSVDGELGPKTIAIIKKWQSDHGLVSDGLIGPMTKAQMHGESSGKSGSGSSSMNSSVMMNSSGSTNSNSSGNSGSGSNGSGNSRSDSSGSSKSGSSSSGSSMGGINY